MRLCSRRMRKIVDRLFFRSAVVVRTLRQSLSAARLAESMSLLHVGQCAHLTALTIYGASRWGNLIVKTEQLWTILNVARAVRTVVLAYVRISDPPSQHAVVTTRTPLTRFSVMNAELKSASTLIHMTVAIGIVGWLHLERITFKRTICSGRGSLSADELHCRKWMPTANRVSFFTMSWNQIGAATSTFSAADGRASRITELDLSFRSLAHADNAFALLDACTNIRTLNVYFFSPSLNSLYCMWVCATVGREH